MATLFERVRDVVVRQLKVDPEEVTAEAHLMDDTGDARPRKPQTASAVYWRGATAER